jgi:hypothetical protein
VPLPRLRDRGKGATFMPDLSLNSPERSATECATNMGGDSWTIWRFLTEQRIFIEKD